MDSRTKCHKTTIQTANQKQTQKPNHVFKIKLMTRQFNEHETRRATENTYRKKTPKPIPLPICSVCSVGEPASWQRICFLITILILRWITISYTSELVIRRWRIFWYRYIFFLLSFTGEIIWWMVRTRGRWWIFKRKIPSKLKWKSHWRKWNGRFIWWNYCELALINCSNIC